MINQIQVENIKTKRTFWVDADDTHAIFIDDLTEDEAEDAYYFDSSELSDETTAKGSYLSEGDFGPGDKVAVDCANYPHTDRYELVRILASRSGSDSGVVGVLYNVEYHYGQV